jgi:tetrahydromethanopterin:alpha-L-glutamate ligase
MKRGARSIGLLAARPGGWHGRDLRRGASRAGVEIVSLDFEDLRSRIGEAEEPSPVQSGASDLRPLGCLLVRSIPVGSLEQIVFRMDALQRVQAGGVPVVNPPAAIECAVDKHLTLSRMAAAGLPVPRTRVSERAEAALADFQALGGDTVLKPLFGSAGRGIIRLSDLELAGRAFRMLERLGAVIYQQEFVAHPRGDLRVLVVGGEAVLAMRRRPAGPPGGKPEAAEWRANVARGGEPAPHTPSGPEAELAVRAAAAVGAEIAGVDLLPSDDGRLLLSEVNSAPGWRALARVTGADVAALVIAHLKRRGRP